MGRVAASPGIRSRYRAEHSAWLGMFAIKSLDQGDFIATIVITKLIHEATGEHDAEAALAETQLVTQLDMADRVLVASGMG